jgi:hypothetical protein
MNSSGAKSALIKSLSDQSGNNPGYKPESQRIAFEFKNVEGDIPMRTILLAGVTAVGLALAATSGASAQYYGGYSNYGYSYPSYNYGYRYGYRPYGYSYRPSYGYRYGYRYY